VSITLHLIGGLSISEYFEILCSGGWIDHRFTYTKLFYVSPAQALFEKRTVDGVLLAGSFTTNEENFTVCTHIRSVQHPADIFGGDKMIASRFCT